MTYSIIPVSTENCSLEVIQENGSVTSVEMPGAAQVDASFLAMWLHGKSEKTRDAYLVDMKKFYAFLNLPLQQVKLEDFQAFINSLAGLKASSRARAIASVKSALSFGVKTGYLKFNVGAVVKLPKLENKLAERIMSEQQVARMFALEENPRNHAILTLLYRAGLRAMELCNLTWRNLQDRDQAGQIAVYGKGKKTRFVLLDSATWQEVNALRTPEAGIDDYVFTSRQQRSRGRKNDRRLDESMIYRIVEEAAIRAKVALYTELEPLDGQLVQVTRSRVSPHWMRHAHATHSLERGAPITLVQDTLGHKSIETTAKYTHVRPNASSTQFLKV